MLHKVGTPHCECPHSSHRNTLEYSVFLATWSHPCKHFFCSFQGCIRWMGKYHIQINRFSNPIHQSPLPQQSFLTPRELIPGVTGSTCSNYHSGCSKKEEGNEIIFPASFFRAAIHLYRNDFIPFPLLTAALAPTDSHSCYSIWVPWWFQESTFLGSEGTPAWQEYSKWIFVFIPTGRGRETQEQIPSWEISPERNDWISPKRHVLASVPAYNSLFSESMQCHRFGWGSSHSAYF